MSKQVNLLEGSISGALAKLALPIMGTSFLQMAYNLVDMIWIGRISANAVAAVGAAGMYIWLSAGFTILARMGGQVLVGLSLGAGKRDEAVHYARASLQLGILLGLLYGLVMVVGNRGLIGFFHLNSQQVVDDARHYLMITGGFLVFNFVNQILTGLLTAMGSSAVTFRATTVGLLLNLVLDPLLIFGAGPLPAMGAAGAAWATVLAQAIVCLMFVLSVTKEPMLFQNLRLLSPARWTCYQRILTVGLPTAVQSVLFTGISMVIARLVAGWGDAAVAVQKVGSQIESISWMTAEGFGSAVSAFTAQNHGAGKTERVKKGCRTAMGIGLAWGLFTTTVLLACPEVLFRIFIREDAVIPMGVDYLRILGLSQLFLCLEATAAGTFQGLGKTLPPSVVSIVFTALRIPAAVALMATPLALNGIWWSVSISSITKGTVLTLWLAIAFRRMRKKALIAR